jgi:glycosyltransferase involved in cell wall biosynthesis
MRDGVAPTIPMLATPTAEVAAHEGWDDPSSPSFADIRRIVELEAELIKGSVGVHAISDAIVETFERLYPDVLDRERTHVAHIGRADDSVASDEPESASHPMVLFVGRLEPRKGIDVLLDAMVRVLDEHETVRFVVAGDDRRPGPSGRTWPQEWELRNPGHDRVQFLGLIDDGRLAELLQESTMSVMPSRYESFGLVVTEAMMHCRPSIASDIGGVSELIIDGETGLLVPVDDAGELATAILRLTNDPVEANHMGRRARARYEELFSASAAAARLERLIESALLSPRAITRAQPTGSAMVQ